MPILTTHTHMPTLRWLAEQLQTRHISAEALVSTALAKAALSENVFIQLNPAILERAREIDCLRENGALAHKNNAELPALAGIPITLKDLFDVQGEITLAGSKVLQSRATPARADSDVVAALRRAGLLLLGRVNMSEFAFSGTGLNPHFGTPKSIWDRHVDDHVGDHVDDHVDGHVGRLPGGSSSGSAVSVAEGIVAATMGSDTAGSCRIPAAFNGIVGVKPSFNRLSLAGMYPLSPTSDAPGPMGVDVDSCFLLDQLLAGQWNGMRDERGKMPDLARADCSSLQLLVPEGVVMDDLDDEVINAYRTAVDALKGAGASISVAKFPAIDQCVEMFLTRSVVGYEALQIHQERLAQFGDEYDPEVKRRILSFENVRYEEQAQRYIDKANLVQEFAQGMRAGGFHAVIYPTTPGVPPKMAVAQNPLHAASINLRCLRNTASVNYFDGCSVSLPCHQPGQAPVGLMVSCVHGDDAALYQIAGGIERVLNDARGAMSFCSRKDNRGRG